jgi:hypothetical protein
MSDDRRAGWVQYFTKSGRPAMVTLAAPPPKKVEGTHRQKFGGAPTHVFVNKSVASTGGWHVDRGYCTLPAEFAKYLIRVGHARLAKPGEMPNNEGE